MDLATRTVFKRNLRWCVQSAYSYKYALLNQGKLASMSVSSISILPVLHDIFQVV